MIAFVHSVSRGHSPDKLRHLGPVADVYELLRRAGNEPELA
jgi:hypothetical protein